MAELEDGEDKWFLLHRSHRVRLTVKTNSVIERWNKSAKEECLNHVVFVSEEHLRQYVTSYIHHYNAERPHQGINNVPIGPWTVGTGEIVCDESLDGLLKSFRRAA